jgi:ketosteroid isomerase-like protein
MRPAATPARAKYCTPMSEAQLEALRGLNVAFNERADWVAFYDPEAEFHMPVEWPEEPVYRGEAGLRKVVQLWTENFDEYHWDEKRLVEVPPDRVVGLYNMAGQIKGTETQIDQAIGIVFRFRGERIDRVDAFFSWAAALETAGLSWAEAAPGE